MDKLAALRAFTRVVELERFSAAARDLGVSNAWVSKTIRALESELGTALLVRTTRQLHLTEVGRTYYERAVAILAAVDAADAGARRAESGPRGTLRISAPMSLGLTDLNARLLRFAAGFPELTIDLRLDDRYVDLVEGGFDLALRAGDALPDSTLRARALAPVQRTLCASPGWLAHHGPLPHPTALEALPCLHYTLARARPRWTLSRGDETVTVEVAGPYRANSSIALLEAVEAGHGVALLPDFVAAPALRSGAVLRVLPGWHAPAAQLHAVYPAHRERSAKIRALIDFLVEDYSTTNAAQQSTTKTPS
jgi:DNA-binding transcriptional LysR family regulator